MVYSVKETKKGGKMIKILGIILLSILVLGNVSLVSLAAGPEHNHHESMGQDHDMDYELGEQNKGNGDQDLGLCIVMGNPVESKEYSYTYEGKVYYFCCPGCIDQFKKDPQEYISRIKEFKLEAYQFGFDPSEIVVKKGDIVRLLISTRDIRHGVYIKEYGVNVSVNKGEVKKVEFIAKKSGDFPILCSVYCGRGHHSMKGKLVVEK